MLDKRLLLAKKDLLLSFSTLGCPDWSLDQVIDFAVRHSYKGVEIRGIKREMVLSKSPHFANDKAIKESSKKFADKGLKVVCLGSSAAMHHSDETERNKSMDEAKGFIEIANKLDCPYVRVFPDKLPESKPREQTMELIADGLNKLSDFSKGSMVKVLMETHGDLVRSDDLVTVMKNVNGKNAGLVWDISNMWAKTGEAPSVVYPKLKQWIFHTHLKDLKKDNGKEVYTMFGEGEVPIFESIDLLLKDNYKGYYSFEWEKMWHPEIAEPEIAIPQYAEAMKKYFDKA
jgi:sugar phosphate isomerase/epimerase